MQKKLLYLFFLFVLQISFAQTNLSWQGYFSYTQIKAVSQSPTAIYAASENALFSKNANTGIIKTTTTIDGLSGETITALYYSPTSNKTIVGYQNGLLIVINEADGSMLKVVDIINKNIPTNVKRINNFMEYGGILYVATDFGIVQFNLTTSRFGDTYFIGDNGAEIKVSQTTVYNGFIYASTSSGIRKGDIKNPNLIDYKQWQVINAGNWSGITAFEKDLYAVNAAGYVHKYDSASNTFTGFLPLPEMTTDFRTATNYFVITTPNTVYVYNKQMVLQRQINKSQISGINSTFSCATITNDFIYIGTTENGLINTSLSTVSNYENITPIGPSRNTIFSMQVSPTQLWAVYGDYDIYYNPYPLDDYGLSKFTTSGWSNISYDKVLGAKSMTRIAINPSNEKEVYASSFFSGLLKIENDVPTVLYNQTNSGLESLSISPPDPKYIDIRINGAAFDKLGNFWVTNSRVGNGLKVVSASGQWKSYAMDKILVGSSSNDFGTMVIDKNGTKWMSTSKNGVVGFNESSNAFKKITFGPDQGNLPVQDVRAVAVDNKNELWIGTTKGLRILSNVGSFQTDNQLKTHSIIIMEDNLAQELLYEQFITDIEVDGANNKWIGTADAGVFMVSPNGQETKYHFTTDNSPLPSNVINDISINSSTGEVFIATSKGLISFKGIATSASENLNNVYVFPNPVRPEYEGTVKINGLLNKANVKITDVAGNLVYEATSEGGTLEWDTTAFGKHKVASGVYMIFVSAQDGMETKVKKVMIIR
ncbi:T9SS type A sorting domain-containing protein [Flavobacterium sp. ZT3R18]|uniref:type IX secretion system anionic LPS delivery protein PorZ n=1 Tax=Flavobacterium sp. ZT3R18 TaxID=2594429 RepID=UPI00117A9BEC|nr:T9SS type A sorting domain-containing protein [Flavobacterium sp. ZT3R18]TRX38001.1 T9SS type A sorting domain-containing protein [Flavobacterium sp. ZT3R18]